MQTKSRAGPGGAEEPGHDDSVMRNAPLFHRRSCQAFLV
jgi:hypothetical protein